jgi:hypothetical protein
MKITSILFIFCCFLSARFSFAQYKITFLVKQFPVLHKGDRLFVAGSFNEWNPGDTEFEIDSTKNEITLLLSPGNYEYKFTRGNWLKVESTAGGKGISNHTLKVSMIQQLPSKYRGGVMILIRPLRLKKYILLR